MTELSVRLLSLFLQQLADARETIEEREVKRQVEPG